MSETPMIIIAFISRGAATCGLQVCYVYTPEAYPTAMRSVALGTGIFVGKFSAFFTPYLAQVLVVKSVKLTFLLYALIGGVGSITALLLPKETSGKPLTEVH